MRARRLSQRLRSARGALDLASVMVGAIVVAVLGSVIAAGVLVAVPWAGEKAAQEDLTALTDAETVYFAKSTDGGSGEYVIDFDGTDSSNRTLDTAGLVKHRPSQNVSVITNWNGTAYIARSIAPSGTRYYATSGSDRAEAKAGEPLPSAIRAFAKANTILPWPEEPSSAAFAEMWSWGNSVDHAADARGEGRAEMTPTLVASFARARHLSQVHVSVPWAADSGGVMTDWVSQTVSKLHGEGIKVTALGGDGPWVSDPGLVKQWIDASMNAAPFDSIQLDVEPWSGNPNWRTDSVSVGQFLAMLQAAHDSAHARGTTLGLDIPWWFAATPYAGGTVLDAAEPLIDRAVLVAFSDHADGQDGIIALAQPAAQSLNAAGIPFTVGVETDTAAVARGAEFTFAEEGEHVLEEETGKVADAFAGLPRFRGICVEHYRAWAVLPN